MTRSILKATTALSVSLSLMQPIPVVAQSLIRPTAPEACGSDVCGFELVEVQTCAEDPTMTDCPPPEAVPSAPEATPEATPPADEAPATTPEQEATTPDAAAPAADQPPTDADTAPTQEQAPEVQPAPEAAQPTPEATQPETAPAAEGAIPAQPAPAETAPETQQPEAAPAPSAPAATMPEAEQTTAPADAPAAEAAPAQPTPEAAPPTPEATVPQPAQEETAPAPDESSIVAPVPDPVPEPTAEQAQALETMLADPEVAAAVDTLAETITPSTDAAPQPDTALSALAAMQDGAAAAPAAADVTTQTLGADSARSSTQDFATTLNTAPPTEAKKKDGLSDLEKAGLVALGAVAVGMLINKNRVVANSGDRVVVDRGNGDLAIWKDDNANLRAPGVVETNLRYSDGSTLTTIERPDGSQIITVRDATGRVIRRDRITPDGTRVPLIDDTRAYQPVDVSQLPRPRLRELQFTDDTDPALMMALLEQAQSADLGRSYSLAQVRDIQQLRQLAPELTARPITFATASSAIRPEEAGKLAQIAGLMNDLIAKNPRELFLIEGHTDAVGGAAYNLALSDRRAESVALALSQIFGVPAENMVVQGYGERFLKVNTQADEPQNRRVALRQITWLVDGET